MPKKKLTNKERVAREERMVNKEPIVIDGVQTFILKGLSNDERNLAIEERRAAIANDEQRQFRRLRNETAQRRFDKRRAVLIEKLGGVDQVKANIQAMRNKPQAK